MPGHLLMHLLRLFLLVSIMDIVASSLACQATTNQVWPEVDLYANLNSKLRASWYTTYSIDRNQTNDGPVVTPHTAERKDVFAHINQANSPPGHLPSCMHDDSERVSSSNWGSQGSPRLISRPPRRKLSNNTIEDNFFVYL
jgi:hypothetical protein